MTNSKSTKRALLSSALVLLLCFSMLLGTTFAWFTDSASSERNKIVAGNLDLAVYYALAVDGEGNMVTDIAEDDWKPLTAETDLFDDTALWEPGHTEAVYLKVVNEGTLSFKYKMNVNIFSETPGTNVFDGEFKLSDYIMVDMEQNNSRIYPYEDRKDVMTDELYEWVSQINPAAKPYHKALSQLEADETALGSGEAQYVKIGLYMPTTVDNGANYKKGTTAPSIILGVDVIATQYGGENAPEYDGFGNDYDEDAEYPEVVNVYNATELRTAITKAPNGATIYLNEGTYEISSQINIDGKSLNIVGRGDVTVKLTKEKEKAFYIYGSKVAGNTGINVSISNVKIEGNNAKSDIWVRTWETGCRSDVNLTLDNVTCATVIADNNYDTGTVIDINVKESEIGKITLDAAPFGNQPYTTYTNLTYDDASNISSVMIQDSIKDAGMANVTINGEVVTQRGEQLN